MTETVTNTDLTGEVQIVLSATMVETLAQVAGEMWRDYAWQTKPHQDDLAMCWDAIALDNICNTLRAVGLVVVRLE